MYPELTVPLLVLLAVALGVTLILILGSPVLRRLAFRQIARRRTEAILIVSGSILGTALIVSSLSVGDSLDTSIRRVAVERARTDRRTADHRRSGTRSPDR